MLEKTFQRGEPLDALFDWQMLSELVNFAALKQLKTGTREKRLADVSRVTLVRSLACWCIAYASVAFAAPPGGGDTVFDQAAARAMVVSMKTSPKGPFDAIRWYCRDGSVLPPSAGACRAHGGGVQHGRLGGDARALRAAGYFVANHLADADATAWLGDAADLRGLGDILLERFLIQADDGWIFRGARTYRGAFQVEDEEAGAARILANLVSDAAWLRSSRFLLLREVARLLPAQGNARTTHVRQLAVKIADRDPDFADLRAKIHGMPDAGDTGRVRGHARSKGRQDAQQLYEELAVELEALYDTSRSVEELRAIAGKSTSRLRQDLDAVLVSLAKAATPRERLAIAARGTATLRDSFGDYDATRRVQALRASLLLERLTFSSAPALRELVKSSARRWSAELLLDLGEVLYGTGLLSVRQRGAVRDALERLTGAQPIELQAYRDDLRWLARIPSWASRALELSLGPRIAKIGEIEPLARELVPDRLRGSPLLLSSHVVDLLQGDAATMAGAEHSLFGKRVSGGLRALNPGIARGRLGVRNGDEGFEHFSSESCWRRARRASSSCPPTVLGGTASSVSPRRTTMCASGRI